MISQFPMQGKIFLLEDRLLPLPELNFLPQKAVRKKEAVETLRAPTGGSTLLRSTGLLPAPSAFPLLRVNTEALRVSAKPCIK
jgi:hypothetical protein